MNANALNPSTVLSIKMLHIIRDPSGRKFLFRNGMFFFFAGPKTAKKVYLAGGLRKKYIHGPAVGILLDLRKKKHSRPARGDHGEGSGDASHEAPSTLWPLGREIF